MKQRKFSSIFLVFLIASIFLPSCKTFDYFQITVLEPAEIFLPDSISKLVLYHNFQQPDTNSTSDLYKIFDDIKTDSCIGNKSLADTTIYSLSDLLNPMGRFQVSCFDSFEYKFPKSAEQFTFTDVGILKQMCDSCFADAVLLLADVTRYDKYDVYSNLFGHYIGAFEVMITSTWFLINPYTPKLLDKKVFRDTFYFEVAPMALIEAEEACRVRNEVLHEAFVLAGQQYGYRISPYWAETDRMVFKSGNKFLKNGYNQARNGEWKNAAHYWKQGLADNDQKNQAKAAFNLALASEMEGLLNPALEWAKISYLAFPDTINGMYKTILEKRLQQHEALLIQMKNPQPPE